MQNNYIQLIGEVNCSSECSSISNLFFTKLFESNYYFSYSLNGYLSIDFSLRSKLKGPIMNFLIVMPFFNHIIGHSIFFYQKSYAFLIRNMLYSFGILLIAKKSMIYFKIYMSVVLLIFYFSGVKFFFETIFPYLIQYDPEITLKMVPLLLFFIKLIANWMLTYPYWERIEINIIAICLTSFILFEYIYIGTLHSVLNSKGLYSKDLWMIIIQSFLMEYIGKASLSKKLFIRFKNFLSKLLFKKNHLQKRSNPMKCLYYGIKHELEIYSALIYLLMLCVKYYDYCMTPLVDCRGRPIVSVSKVKPEHFALVVILLSHSL